MAVEGRTWNLNLRLSFFLGRGVRKYKSPGHVTVPVPHIPFATRSGAMQSPDGRTFPFIDSYGPRAAALSLRPASGPSAVSLAANAGRTTAGLSCAGRALLCLAGTFMVRIRLGRSGVRCRSAAVRRVRDGRKIGPDRPFPLVGSQCRVSGRPVSGPKVRMCKSSARPKDRLEQARVVRTTPSRSCAATDGLRFPFRFFR